MVSRLFKRLIEARGTYVFLLLLFVFLFVGSAYNASDVLFTSGKDRLVATTHTSSDPDVTAPILNINGLDFVVLDQGDVYEELGATAFDNVDGDISANITVTGFVDTSIPGFYDLIYFIQDAHGNYTSDTRRVQVNAVDNDPPVLEVLGNNPTYLDIGASFFDLGAKIVSGAGPNIGIDTLLDGVPVSQVYIDTSEAGSYTITYQAADSSGNIGEIERFVYVGEEEPSSSGTNDTEPPLLTLIGDEDVFIYIGETVDDPGATAYDDVDGDLTDEILVFDATDNTEPGFYIIRYVVADEAGNQSFIERNVEVRDFAGSDETLSQIPPDVTSIDPRVSPGDQFTLNGTNLTYVDKVYLRRHGDASAEDFSVDFTIHSVSEITVRVPLSTEEGRHIITTESSFGKDEFAATVLVTRLVTEPTIPPFISSIEPNRVKVGERVTIYGSDFPPTAVVEVVNEGFTLHIDKLSGTQIEFIVSSAFTIGKHTLRVSGKGGFDDFKSNIETFEVAPVSNPTQASGPPVDYSAKKDEPSDELGEDFKDDDESSTVRNSDEPKQFDNATILSKEEAEAKREERRKRPKRSTLEALREQLGETERSDVVDIRSDSSEIDVETKIEEREEIPVEEVEEFEKELKRIWNETDFEFDFAFDEEEIELKEELDLLVAEIQEEERLFENREKRALRKDSDEDGITDYDEIAIFKTNPFDSKTRDGDLTDADKILSGINPVTDKPIEFENPKEIEQPSNDVFRVRDVKVSEVVQDEATGEEKASKLVFEGEAPPNSFITLYIFSTPIIITVKTDADGRWQYELDKELEDGAHEIYVATVDNTGKIVAKSDPIPFVKEASAAELGTVIATPEESTSFLRGNFLIILISIAMVGVLIMIIVVASDMRGATRRGEVAGTYNQNDSGQT